MLNVDQLFRSSIYIAESFLHVVLILLGSLLRLKPGQAALQIAAARLRRRGNYASSLTLLFVACLLVVLGLFGWLSDVSANWDARQ